jgi:predicted acyl esterase
VTLKDFHWFARRVPAGSRLQLGVRHTGSIHLDRNHHTGRPDGMETPDDVRVANVTILHSGDHRSRLRLPIASTWQPPES